MKNEGLLWERVEHRSPRANRRREAKCLPTTSGKPSATGRSGPGAKSVRLNKLWDTLVEWYLMS